MTAKEKLLSKNNDLKFVCIGLDTDLEKIPKFILNEKEPIYFFNKKIIEATKNYAAAYKINFAFYESLGSYGFELIKKTLDQIPNDILVIADAKRGDIANTSEMYAKSIFEFFNFDSVTLNPYMGFDSLEPFFSYKDKLHFILALTSNLGANDFEKLQLINGDRLYQYVIKKIVQWDSIKKNCGIVFGATNLNELSDNILSMQNCSVLLPGVGKQGGSFEDVIKIFKAIDRKNFIINLSRSILYVDNSVNFDKTAEKEVIKLNQQATLIFKD